MITLRTFTISFLSALSIVALLYYTLFSQGPHLLLSFQISGSRMTSQPSNGEPTAGIAKGSELDFAAVEKFDPETLLSAPRRNAAVPSPNGDLAVYTVSTYSFASHVKTAEIRVVDLASGQSRLITNDEEAGSPNWLAGRELIWLKTGANSTKLIVGHADEAGQTHVAASISAPISDFKVKQLSDGKFAIVLVAKALPNGNLYSPGQENHPRSSALLFDNLFVRHWDKYVTPSKNALWHGILEAPKSGLATRQGSYTLSKLTNIQKDAKLESPIAPFGGVDDFDLSSAGVIFVAKDPSLNPAFNTKSSLYIVSIASQSNNLEYTAPLQVSVEGFEGASASPRFSSDGKRIVFLQMKQNGYESDQNQIIVLDTAHRNGALEVISKNVVNDGWNRSPSSVSFGRDFATLVFTAEDLGRVKLFTLDISDNTRAPRYTPTPLTEHGQVSSFNLLGDAGSLLLVSGTSFIDNSFYLVLDISGADPARLVTSSSQNGTFFHLSSAQVSEIWFDGADGFTVHAWVIKPSDFEPDKTYPLAYLIHGGPQGSWAEDWSTRWYVFQHASSLVNNSFDETMGLTVVRNPMIFAEQGYIVVLPDPTGSTGYGQEFTDNIQGQWGGRPYQDLVNGFEHIKNHLHYVDTDRAVALGASYGGYMMAWIQGQPLGRVFKALVCHDGSFILPAQLASDEQYFPNHEMGGPITENEHQWDEWSPHLHISNWTTPMLVIHNELDYRLPISEGLAMFNVLQERGIKSRFLSFPDENHWVLKEENSLVWHTVVINWINSFVGLPSYKDEADLGIVVQN